MEDLTGALEEVRATSFTAADTRVVRLAASTPRINLIRGRDAIGAMAEMLQQLCQRTGQDGAMDCLDYMLHTPTAMEKIPTLVLVGLSPGVKPGQATAEDVAGAVLLYEYRAARLGMRVFATDDTTGERTVIAPADQRQHVAETACLWLIRHGALIALISLESCGPDRDEDRARARLRPGRSGMCWLATQRRAVPRYLQLHDSIEATLATLGRHTRRNLRYYRRRAEIELGAVFVPHVEMGMQEFLEVNRRSMHPVPDSIAVWRFDAIQRTQGAMFSGVKAHDGRWLSLIGGRRQMQVTEIDWQMNLGRLPRHSLSTVMRSYVLEREIALGTKKLVFTGGTPHSMRHSFVQVDAADVIVLRRSLPAQLLRRFAPWIFPQKNFLGQLLRDRRLEWIEA